MNFLEDLTDIERMNFTALDGCYRQFNRRFFQIAYLLDFFKSDERYKKCNCNTFDEFCFENFKLEKTLVSRLLKSWKRFGEVDSKGNLTQNVKKEFKDYNFSQLVELLPLSDSEIEYVSSKMTVKQLRDFKKKLKEEKESKSNKTPDFMLQELQLELLNGLGRFSDKYPGSVFTLSRNSYCIEYENCTFDISLKVKGLK